jgi:hypothetical protein
VLVSNDKVAVSSILVFCVKKYPVLNNSLPVINIDVVYYLPVVQSIVLRVHTPSGSKTKSVVRTEVDCADYSGVLHKRHVMLSIDQNPRISLEHI